MLVGRPINGGIGGDRGRLNETDQVDQEIVDPTDNIESDEVEKPAELCRG